MGSGVVRSEGRSGAVWFLVIGLVSALIAAWVAVRLVQAARHEISVVVAQAIVPPLTAITAADVQWTSVPAAAVPKGAIRSLSGVTGHFTRLGLVPGEVVTTTALFGTISSVSSFDYRLAQLDGLPACQEGPSKAAAGVTGLPTVCGNLVGMVLPLSVDQGFAEVNAGDRVDVLGVFSVQTGAVAEEILRDAPVLATSTGPSSAASASSGWIVLALTAEQALRLELAESEGKVDVVLRPTGSSSEVAGPSIVTLPDLASTSSTS